MANVNILKEAKNVFDIEINELEKLKNKINFTVACVDEFAQKNNLSVKEAFQYLFQFKGIEFIKENYEAEHTLSFDTVLEDLGILCRRNGGKL